MVSANSSCAYNNDDDDNGDDNDDDDVLFVFTRGINILISSRIRVNSTSMKLRQHGDHSPISRLVPK